MQCPQRQLGRRRFLALLGIGLAAAVTACTNAPSAPSPPAPPAEDPLLPPAGASGAGSRVLTGGPADRRRIALTVDDGYCDECVAGYVEFARRTGIHLTFSPNGLYAHAWAPQASVLRPLIDAGQIQVINHTFTHPKLTTLPPDRVREELERNEEWINKTFGTTAVPYYRPPYGLHDPAVDETAASLGLDRVVLWNGSFGDSHAIPATQLIEQARRYLQPGEIVLGHANHPTVLGLFDQITALIHERNLNPVTLDELFGTRRPAPAPGSSH